MSVPFLAPAWSALTARCTPEHPSPAQRAVAETYAVIVAAGAPAFVAFIVADVIRGFEDVSYWREIPVNVVVFLSLAGLAVSPGLPLWVRGAGLALPLTALSISDQLQAGAGGLAPVILVMNSATLALWNRRAASIGAGLAILAIGGPALIGVAPQTRTGGPESLARLSLRLAATLVAGVAVARGIRGLAGDSGVGAL